LLSLLATVDILNHVRGSTRITDLTPEEPSSDPHVPLRDNDA